MEKSASAFSNGPTEKWFPAYEVSRNKLHKAHCFDRLVDLVKEKKSYLKKKKKKQIQWLSLVPQTWSIGLIVQVFETTEYKAKNSSKLLQ